MHDYVAFAIDADPIEGSSIGHRPSDARLGDVTPDALAYVAAERRSRLAAVLAGTGEPGAAPSMVGSAEWLEGELLRCELHARVLTDEHQRPSRRAPYWYAERAGEALGGLLSSGSPNAAADLAARLRELPDYLAAGAANLDAADVPTLWAEMGAEAADGLERFLATDLATFIDGQPDAARRSLGNVLAPAAEAVATFGTTCRRLAREGTGSWVAGHDYVAGMLADHHRLTLTPESLSALGEALVDEADAALTEHAARREPGTPWLEQLERIKDRHPEGEQFVATYDAATQRSRRWVLDHHIATIPDGEQCVVEWVPEFLRSSLPMGCMNTVQPYGDDLTSRFLITPLDPAATDDRRQQHRRDNCYAFVDSIAGHETYPGHHLQSVAHVLGTHPDSVGRYLRSSLFVEGWGLYVEDLLEESGAVDSDVVLFARRNALWRALRIVIDTGLHTGRMSFDDAVDLLCRRAGMGRHMSVGEVRRYTRHDNPTYPSSYVLGRREFHRLRQRWTAEHGPELRPFHDAMLAHGSPPFALLEPVLFGPDATSDGRGDR